MSEEREVRDSMPSRKDSRERDIWASWDGLGSMEREMARCRSRRESLMWSARRKSCEGFDMVGERLLKARGTREGTLIRLYGNLND